MLELLTTLLPEHGRGRGLVRRLSIRLLAYGTVGLLLLATLGFLMVALHETFLRLSDHVTAPLLVAATLATGAAIVVLAMWLIHRVASQEREPRGRKHDADDLLLLIGRMSEAIADKKVPPLTVVGLALATGLAQGLRK